MLDKSRQRSTSLSQSKNGHSSPVLTLPTINLEGLSSDGDSSDTPVEPLSRDKLMGSITARLPVKVPKLRLGAVEIEILQKTLTPSFVKLECITPNTPTSIASSLRPMTARSTCAGGIWGGKPTRISSGKLSSVPKAEDMDSLLADLEL